MSAIAVPVTPEWLLMREPADAAARSAELAERLARYLPADGRLVVHDLGGGSGAMGRWLAPRLARPQHWVVHDRDEGLLPLALLDPPRASGITVEARRSDVAGLASEDLADAGLVVASALLDLVTADELAGMVGACAGVPMLLALNVTGRVALSPAEPLDARVGAAFDAHQRRDGLLGPDAVAAVVEELRGTGAEVVVRPSPWRLGAAHAALAAEWLAGWLDAACEQDPALAAEAGAACEQDPALAAEAGAYRERRMAQAAAGELAVTVDHADVLVLP